MSSEEMRIELEAFVNTGLREGWSGWPLKEGNGLGEALPLHPSPARVWSRREKGLTDYGGRFWVFGIGGRYYGEN